MKKHYRVLASLMIILFFTYWTLASSKIGLPHQGELPKLYSNQCNDDLRKVFLTAINEAKESIVLIIYSMDDRYIIDALKKKAEKGILVTVVHDAKTKQYGFKALGPKISRYAKEKGGIMHQKILIIDKSKVYLGSANLTSTSLRVHDNLVMGCESKLLSEAILGRHEYLQLAAKNAEHVFFIGGQKVEFWSFPEEGEEGLEYLLSSLEKAKKSLKIAMFTWTHPRLTEAMFAALKRGVKVEVVLDKNQGMGVSKKSAHALAADNVPVFFSQSELCHHKMAIIDDTILIVGSANWTKSAFSRNDDCFVIIYDLRKEQLKKLNRLWRAISCSREEVDLLEAA